jgi:hypothetical protein
MTDGQERSSGQTELQQQASEILGDVTESVNLTNQLDFGYVEHNDEYAAWHASTPLRAMVRALFLKELEGWSFSELHRNLDANPEDAAALGFDDLPSRTTFGRAWRDRFDDQLRHTIEYNARTIRDLAHEMGCPIGLNAIEPEEKDSVSDRTEDRFINRKAKEVTEEMQRLVSPAFDFDRAENAITIRMPSANCRATSASPAQQPSRAPTCSPTIRCETKALRMLTRTCTISSSSIRTRSR